MNNENEGQARKTLSDHNSIKKKEAKKVSGLDGVVCSTCGERITPVYKRVYDDELGRDVVKQVDTYDLQEFIEASAASTDLAMLQKRFIELGEIPNADPTLQFGVDTTNLPTDIHGVYNMVNDVASNFARLPKSIQDIFGNKEAYLQSILNGTYQATLFNAMNNMKEEEKKEGNE